MSAKVCAISQMNNNCAPIEPKHRADYWKKREKSLKYISNYVNVENEGHLLMRDQWEPLPDIAWHLEWLVSDWSRDRRQNLVLRSKFPKSWAQYWNKISISTLRPKAMISVVSDFELKFATKETNIYSNAVIYNENHMKCIKTKSNKYVCIRGSISSEVIITFYWMLWIKTKTNAKYLNWKTSQRSWDELRRAELNLNFKLIKITPKFEEMGQHLDQFYRFVWFWLLFRFKWF